MNNKELPQKSEMSSNEAKDTLERTINFVSNCDNKASIILGIIGVIFTIIFTNDSLLELKNIIKIIIQFKNRWDIVFLILGLGSIIILACGLGLLVFCLIAKIDCKEYKQERLNLNSIIYFGNIAEYKSFKDYEDRFLNVTEENYLNDLLSQIYLNSCICMKKYKRYNLGVICSICGLMLFSIYVIAGNFVY